MRALAADHATDLFDADARGRFGPASEEGLALPPVVIAGLAGVLAEHPDPNAIWLAGEILNLSGSPEALAALLDHAERRGAGDIDRNPGINVSRHVRTHKALERTLSYIEEKGHSPWMRLELAEATLSLGWLESLPAKLKEAAQERIARWVVDRVPLLDAGLAESILEAWRDQERESDSDGDAAFVQRTLREAVARIPSRGPRLRLESQRSR